MRQGLISRVLLGCFLSVMLITAFSTPLFPAAKWAYITVVIDPEEVRGTARFIISGNQYVSGHTVRVNAQDNQNYTVQFTAVEGYQSPEAIGVFVNPGDEQTMTGTYYPSGGSSDIGVTDLTKWPVWPQKRTNYNVWEPYSFLSIGRDVVSWVVFDPMAGNPTFWLSDLRVILKTDEGVFAAVDPDFDFTGQTYGYIVGSTVQDFPSALSGISSHLRSYAVLPGYIPEWMTRTVGDVSENFPNQDFQDSWFSYSGWMDFLRGDAGFDLEDSGHAPPLTMYPKDNWLTFFLDENSAPAAWADKVFIFLPTNQGVLNCFKTSQAEESPGVKRVWSITPFPAFQQAVYNQVRKQNDGSYSRMTVLDGPVYVHDVQNSSGTWKRILVGTTGLGTEQQNKIGSNWTVEGAPQPSGAPTITGESRVFGIYAIDVTDPLSPVPLWSVTNISCPRAGDASVSRVDILNAAGGSIDPADYEQVDFMTSKPLIGFTETPGGDRTWHLLMVTIDKSGQYLWLNADPLTGEVITKGTFDGFNGETTEVLPSEDYYSYNFEDWYPSRMLAAYPGEGGLPVLSDVYIYLSNGTFYSWDLSEFAWNPGGSNTGAPVPTKICNIFTNTGHEYPAPPITDFDICYIDGDTYLAATAPLDYPGVGSPHDTYGLLIINLTRIQNEEIEDLNTQGALGQGGDTKIRLMEDGVAMVQLQTGTGSNAYDFDALAASPVFANYILFQALYSSEGTLSRLYTLDMGYFADITRTSGNLALPDDAYLDDPDHVFAQMIIDSEGNLVIFDAEGNVVGPPIHVLDLNETGTGTGGTADTAVRIVYWKIS